MWQLVEESHHSALWHLCSHMGALLDLSFWICRREHPMIVPVCRWRSVSSSSPYLESYHPTERTDCGSLCPWGLLELTWLDGEGRIWCQFLSERNLNRLYCASFVLSWWEAENNLPFFLSWQNWSGMRCQFKLFRMAMALVCSKFLIIIKQIKNMSGSHQ